MSHFTSDRERWLWLCTLLVVAAIFATLGLASRLAGIWQNQTAAAVAFLTAMFLIAVSIFSQGLEMRIRGREMGVGLGIAVVYFFMLFRMAIPVRSHLIEYTVVAAFIYEALTERARQGRKVPVPAVLAIAATSMIGALDEGVQLFLPNRVFDPVDMLFNGLAAVTAVVALAVLRWARRWGRSARR